MINFAGNMLEVNSMDGERILVMSDTALQSLNDNQLAYISKECKIINPKINYIEKNGGGSARCMIAELFC